MISDWTRAATNKWLFIRATVRGGEQVKIVPLDWHVIRAFRRSWDRVRQVSRRSWSAGAGSGSTEHYQALLSVLLEDIGGVKGEGGGLREALPEPLRDRLWMMSGVVTRA